MSLIGRACAFACAAALVCASSAQAAKTVTIYGGAGAATVSVPDALAAALVAGGRAVVEDPRENDAVQAIIATFSATNIAFLQCVSRGACATPPPVVAVGALDFSDPAQSAFIL